MPKTDSNKTSKSRFRSRSEHNLDVKGRLNIPSRFREVLQGHGNELLMVTNWHKCLKAFPVQIWERIETTLLVQGRKQPGMDAFKRYVISGVTECSLDKQGRILLPPALRSDFDLTKVKVFSSSGEISALLALAFAAGAMIFVVVEELIPESQLEKNTDIATSGAMFGFAVMMTLDVALG